jgi:putative transposase
MSDSSGPQRPGLATLTAFSEADRSEAHRRWLILRPHLDDGVPLTRVATETGVSHRTLQRWLARYRAAGLAGLTRGLRADRGRSRFPEQLRFLIEGLALRKPVPSAAHIHRQVTQVAEREGWPVPAYSTVYAIIRGMDLALRTLAVEGTKRYAEVFELIYRRQAARPNEIWQADHTLLDLWVVTPSGKPARPWLTVIEDDYSRAIAGYAVNIDAPSALQTSLALRQAIWRKGEPGWHICGIPQAFYTDHGSDFTSRHLEQAAADLKIRLVFSRQGQPRGRGKIERYFDTINQMCLPALPGYAPRGTPDRAGQARLSLAELDAAIGRFIIDVYHHRPHGETGHPPQARWDAGGFLPHLPGSLEQLDLLLLTVAQPRQIHPDGIRFQGLRYLDPILAGYVGEQIIIRYDPRDMAEIRVFFKGTYLCRAISPDHAGDTITLKDIQAARIARRRSLRGQLNERVATVAEFLPARAPRPKPSTTAPDPPRPRLRTYLEDTK